MDSKMWLSHILIILNFHTIIFFAWILSLFIGIIGAIVNKKSLAIVIVL